jgi:hypothetical protein
MANATKLFSSAAPKIRAAMHAMGTDRVLDLCSGSGGPWLTLAADLAKTGPARIDLSDLYPNTVALREISTRTQGRVGFHETAVDATRVPTELEGVRTIFNALHHFPPETARAILADAVAKRRAIAVFEGSDTRVVGVLAVPLQALALLLLTPFLRPFRWSRLLWTYAVPLIPLVVLFDGVVSFLRLYLPDDIRTLVAGIPGHDEFEWDIGSTRLPGVPVGLTHLVGIPKR